MKHEKYQGEDNNVGLTVSGDFPELGERDISIWLVRLRSTPDKDLTFVDRFGGDLVTVPHECISLLKKFLEKNT